MVQPRIGVAGAGYWGANLVRNCAQMGALVAVCDPAPAIREDVAARYPGVDTYAQYEEMLQHPGLDAIVIASPAPMHADMALQAIAAGKHCFVEKPLALDVEQAQRVVDAAAAAQRVLFVGHLLLYHPGIVAVLDAIRSGQIGDVRHVRSRRLSWGKLRAQESVWWSFAPHDIAVVLAIVGDEPVAMTRCESAFVRDGVADFAYADLQFSQGRTAHIEVSWLDPDKSSRLDVFGANGTLTFVDSRDGARLTLTQCGDRTTLDGGRELWRGETLALEIPAGEPLRAELDAFCGAVVQGHRVPTDGEEGLAVVRALSTPVTEGSAPPVALGVPA